MLGRSVVLNVVGSVGGLVVGFGGSLVLGRWLGATDRGLLGVMTSFSSVAVGVLGVGMPMAVMYYASRRDTRTDVLLGNSLAWGVGLALVVPLAWALHDLLARALGKGQGGLVWVAAAALVPLTFLDWTTHNQLLGRLRFGLYNLLVVLSKVATLVLVLLLVVWIHGGLIGAIVATGAASVVMIAGSLPPLLREGRPRLQLSLLRTTIGYGARVQVGALFQLLNYRLDVLVLQAFAPLSVVGTYVIAEIVAELATTVASAFGTSVLPLVAGAGDDVERAADTTAASLRHHGIVALASVLANAAFGTAVIWWGYGSQFHAAVAPMLILLPSMWFLGTGQVITGDLRGRGKPGLSSALAGATAVVTVGLDLALIPPFQAIGAAIASCVAYTVFGVASIVAISRVSGIPVRTLVVPTRADLGAYPAAARAALSRLRGSVPTGAGETP